MNPQFFDTIVSSVCSAFSPRFRPTAHGTAHRAVPLRRGRHQLSPCAPVHFHVTYIPIIIGIIGYLRYRVWLRWLMKIPPSAWFVPVHARDLPKGNERSRICSFCNKLRQSLLNLIIKACLVYSASRTQQCAVYGYLSIIRYANNVNAANFDVSHPLPIKLSGSVHCPRRSGMHTRCNRSIERGQPSTSSSD